jgi:uncharacterized protein YggU (UPF0235/DUF167 family)
VRLDVRVTPRASKTLVGGVRDGRLLIRVTAPPVDDAANEAVRRALAHALGLPVRSVRIAAGGTGRNKSVDIEGLDERELRRRLDAAPDDGRRIMRTTS